ncbi:MAG: hypothetical protein AAB334_00870 [Patescibacteria group bacterium]
MPTLFCYRRIEWAGETTKKLAIRRVFWYIFIVPNKENARVASAKGGQAGVSPSLHANKRACSSGG